MLRTVSRCGSLALSILPLVACNQTLVGGLSETQTTSVLLALHQAGIAASREPNGELNTVSVASGELGAALSILARENLPHSEAPGLAETFSGSSLVPTPTEETVRVNSAIATELERTLTSIDGVVSARVHLSLAEAPALQLAPTPIRNAASILIRHRGPLPIQASAVAELVSGAAQAVAVESVHVVFVQVPPLPRMPELARVGPFSVAGSSAWKLRITLLILLSANIISLLLAALLFSRQSRVRSHQSP